ncbi:MAG: 7-cyano-7-deazaguanine synthase QueC [Phycisphaeraceae bacterium]|nr:7-cyano-7-deazaguanine synthase QueC [Phycisphaeraceae bacterium]
MLIVLPQASAGPDSVAVVLLSGGLDSATALAAARDAGFACVTLAIDYGQRHRVELGAAELVSRSLQAREHRIVRLDLRAIGGSALTSDIAVPKNRDEQAIGDGVPITYVPARNMIFLSIATALAEVVGARDIFVGVNAIDYSGYPDCRPEFIDSFAKAANLGTKIGTEALAGHGRGFVIQSPLSSLTKAGIIRLGTKLGVDYSLTTSCYDPKVDAAGKPLACGACDSCQLRRRGFEEAGVPDPTRYA